MSPLEEIQLAISEGYSLAHDQSDGEIVIDNHLRTVYFSLGAQKFCGYKAQDRLIISELFDEFTVRTLADLLKSPVYPCYRLNSGYCVEIRTQARASIKVVINACFLSIKPVHIVLFLRVVEFHSPEYSAAPTTPTPTSNGMPDLFAKTDNPWIQKAQGFLYLLKTSPLAAIVAIAVLGVWLVIPNLATITPLLPKSSSEKPPEKTPEKPAKSGVSVSEKKTAKINEALESFRKSLPHPSESRTFVAIYQEIDGQLYSYLSPNFESSDGLRQMISGNYKVTVGGMLDRFDAHRYEQCFVIDNPSKANDDDLEKRLAERFALYHISCGFQISAQSSPIPHFGFLAAETANPNSAPDSIKTITEEWAKKIQSILSESD